MKAKISFRKLTLGQLDILFRRALTERGWWHDTQDIYVCYKRENDRIEDPFQIDCLNNIHATDVRSSVSDYLELLERRLEHDAHRYLHKWRCRLSINETYDVFVRLIQTPVSRINKTTRSHRSTG